LRHGGQGISEPITEHSLINVDFADVKAIMKNAGSALMGIGRASGENRAVIAAQQAIESPLIEVKIEGARGVLFSVAGGYDMAMSEIQDAAEVITGAVSPEANIIFGAAIRPELEDEIVITVVATGFDSEYYRNLESANEEDERSEIVESVEEEKAEPEEEKSPEEVASDFASENKVNMWDSIKTEPDEDLDIPPSLRMRDKNRNSKQ
jgi:cell division protein FtsZ